MDSLQEEKLIIKRLAGETTVEENEFLEGWVKASEDNRRLLHFHQAVWNDTSLEYKNIDHSRAYKVISDHINSSIKASKSTNQWNRLTMPAYLRAASVILVVTCGIFIWYFAQKNIEPDVQKVVAATVEKEATRGQKIRTFLPDGSVAWLSAESKITYEEFFSDSLRIVHLEGMAYFDVERDSLRPFIVRLQDLDVVVLGTSFSVRSYHSEEIVSVALEEGRVLIKLESEHKEIENVILKPGREIMYNVKSQTYSEVQANPDKAFNWRNGVLSFENASFDEVIRELSKWYGVDFQVINNAQKEWHYTSTFRRFTLKEVLESMSYTQNISYELHPEKVIINHKN